MRRERRLGWWIVAAVAGGVFFWIWSSPDFRPSQKIPINFWTGFTGPDGEQMVGLIREFHRQNPDVEVSLQRIDWGVYYNKLFVAGLGKRGPEVFVMHAGMLPRFASAGLMAEMDGSLRRPDGGDGRDARFRKPGRPGGSGPGDPPQAPVGRRSGRLAPRRAHAGPLLQSGLVPASGLGR
ncbi:MAG: extracellular solute-binding protein [Verrucomicrobia bacterium]|nr:extracellular solute-binding protein [Verrucomicrobiota bacterium]